MICKNTIKRILFIRRKEDQRRKAVLLRNEEIAVRKLNQLEINFNTKPFFEMIDLDGAKINNDMITEPPITEIQHLRIEKKTIQTGKFLV